MNILVLGGSGFVGTHLIERLSSLGHSIKSLSRTKCEQPVQQGVEHYTGDFNNTSVIVDALNDIDVVYHLISSSVPSSSNLDPISDINCNLIGTIQLLELMRKMKNIKKIIYISSGGTVYGNPDIDPVPETYPLNPICSYGVVKVAIEKYLFMYHHLYGVESVILRPSNFFGPRQKAKKGQGVIGAFLENIKKDLPIKVWGDGNIIRDYLYVDDLIDLCILILESNKTGTYNAGYGKGISINELIGTIQKVTDRIIQISYEKGRTFDVEKIVLDIQKAKTDFLWSPNTTLMHGIKNQWEWLRLNN